MPEVTATLLVCRHIGQSHPYPAYPENTITVSLAATIELSGAHDGAIILSGLKGTPSADDARKNITSLSSPSHIASTGLWDGDSDHPFGFGGFLGVELRNASVVAAGQTIVFSFVLSNPSQQQSAQLVTVTWTGVQGFRSETMLADGSVLPLPGSVAGDAAPLLVYPPAFVAKSIRQSSVLPYGVNELHVSLAANVELRGDTHTAVTIHGLWGSNTGRDAHWRILPNTIPITYPSGSPGIFGGNASWIRETGQLELRVLAASVLAPGQICAFSFQVRNAGAAQAESDAIRVWSSSTSAPSRLGITSMDRMPSLLLNRTGALAGDALPLRVQDPGFILASVRQSTTFPGVVDISVSLTGIATARNRGISVLEAFLASTRDGLPHAWCMHACLQDNATISL